MTIASIMKNTMGTKVMEDVDNHENTIMGNWEQCA